MFVQEKTSIYFAVKLKLVVYIISANSPGLSVGSFPDTHLFSWYSVQLTKSLKQYEGNTLLSHHWQPCQTDCHRLTLIAESKLIKGALC